MVNAYASERPYATFRSVHTAAGQKCVIHVCPICGMWILFFLFSIRGLCSMHTRVRNNECRTWPQIITINWSNDNRHSNAQPTYNDGREKQKVSAPLFKTYRKFIIAVCMTKWTSQHAEQTHSWLLFFLPLIFFCYFHLCVYSLLECLFLLWLFVDNQTRLTAGTQTHTHTHSVQARRMLLWRK